jgi:hypothetical protein
MLRSISLVIEIEKKHKFESDQQNHSNSFVLKTEQQTLFWEEINSFASET